MNSKAFELYLYKAAVKKNNKKKRDEAKASPDGREPVSHPSDTNLILMWLQEPCGGTDGKGFAAGQGKEWMG